jgi:sugar transferase EpsL
LASAPTGLTSATRLRRTATVGRAFDVLVAAVLLVATAPLMAAVAIAILLNMGRPVLFRHQRAGLDGAPFELVKFRSMRPLAAGEVAPDSDGVRISKVGRVLRSTSLDELPSLVNVLRGEMRLVGPRPLPVRYLERYTPRQRRRLDVPPGITGWAQINGRNGLGWADRLELDVWYVEHRSFRLDLRIIARTVPVVLRQAGVSAAGHATMAELPVRQDEPAPDEPEAVR